MNLAILLFSLISISLWADEATRAIKPEMKGMELYSWHDDSTQQWRFALLPGTNAAKTTARIMDAKTATKSVMELETRLSALAVGEYVSWNSHVDPKVFSLPPNEVVQQIVALSESKQLKLTVRGQ